MPFDPLPTLNEQILSVLDGIVTNGTEKQNAADALEAFLSSSSFLVEVLNDDLSTTIQDDFDGFAVVSVDAESVVTVSDATFENAASAQAQIKANAKLQALEDAIAAAPGQIEILGVNYAEFLASVTP